MGTKESNSNKTAGYKLFRKIELFGFGYRSDLIDYNYMRRWVFKTPWFIIRLHHILRSDNDRHMHDHPFSFISLILWGSYIEYTPATVVGQVVDRLSRPRRRLFVEGDVNRKKGTDLHYLKLASDTVWTLVFTTPYYRDWGFMTDEAGWIRADQYDAWLAEKDRLKVVK